MLDQECVEDAFAALETPMRFVCSVWIGGGLAMALLTSR